MIFVLLGLMDWKDFQHRRQDLAESTALHGAAMIVAELQGNAHLGERFRQSLPSLASDWALQDDSQAARARLDLLLSEWFPHYQDHELFPAGDCSLRLPKAQAAVCAPTSQSVSFLLGESGDSISLLLRLKDASGAPYMLRVRQEPRRLEDVQRVFSLNAQQAFLYPQEGAPPYPDILASTDIPDTPWRLGVRTVPEVWSKQRSHILQRVGGTLLLVAAGTFGLALLRRRVEHMRVQGHVLEIANERLSDQARHDALTGMYNRYAFGEHFQRVRQLGLREHRPFAVALIDIDHFKQINDSWGHEAGDQALKRVAEVIERSAGRPLDMTARWGGEEFVVLLEGVQGEDAWAWGELLRLRLADLRLPHPSGRYVSVSIGVASNAPGAGTTLKALLARADRALYEAKGAGRDRVIGEWEVDT